MGSRRARVRGRGEMSGAASARLREPRPPCIEEGWVREGGRVQVEAMAAPLDRRLRRSTSPPRRLAASPPRRLLLRCLYRRRRPAAATCARRRACRGWEPHQALQGPRAGSTAATAAGAVPAGRAGYVWSGDGLRPRKRTLQREELVCKLKKVPVRSTGHVGHTAARQHVPRHRHGATAQAWSRSGT